MTFDATALADWQIAEAAEKGLPTPNEWRDRLGLENDEVIPMGRVAKLNFLKIIDRLKDRPDGKYVEVTAITPTPLGEGKSTTALGLIEGLGKRGLNVGGCLRQPSGGPTMNIKGTAAGGGNALLIPMTEFSAFRHIVGLKPAHRKDKINHFDKPVVRNTVMARD